MSVFGVGDEVEGLRRGARSRVAVVMKAFGLSSGAGWAFVEGQDRMKLPGAVALGFTR